MTKLRFLVLASVVGTTGALSAGCYAGVGYSAHATVSTPEPQLVEVSPGLWVIEDYHEPIFYSDGYYWRNTGGVWYRSSYYSGGFARHHSVPVVVRGVRRPARYARYRAHRGARVRAIRGNNRAVRGHNRAVRRNNRAVRHNNRAVRRNNRAVRRGNNRAVRRNNRAVRRNNRAVRRNDRVERRRDKRDRRDRRKTRVRDNR